MDAFLAVVVLVSLLALAGSLIALATSGRSYDQIGRGGLSLAERRADPPAPGAAGERDAEIRQYLAARNERRVARGEPPLDVEAELRALTAPAADPALEAEVRELVTSRNARRIARGQAPLDVDAEVSKRLRGG
jgi:hypothetical protein